MLLENTFRLSEACECYWVFVTKILVSKYDYYIFGNCTFGMLSTD